MRRPPTSTLFPYTTLFRSTSVADRPDDIRAAVSEALTRTGAVLTTGGLGPTRDDITKKIVAELYQDRKSTRLNSSHVEISYAVFCLKKKIKKKNIIQDNND